MYNLLMAGVGWADDGQDTFSISRIGEYTDDRVRDQFLVANVGWRFDRMMKHPCLFMEEGTGDQMAYVGDLIRCDRSGPNVSINFAINRQIPPLLNSEIEAARHKFGVTHDFEFSRTHWAIKENDLYRAICEIRVNQTARSRPKVFELAERETIDPRQISVMMPFDGAFTPVYRALQDLSDELDVSCNRADDIWDHDTIIQDVISLIDRSKIVIVDCSTKNANVFYEAGIAHTLGRNVILIAQHPSDVPFDVGHIRHVRYNNNGEGREALKDALRPRLRTLLGQT